jgi:hypothetical protein
MNNIDYISLMKYFVPVNNNIPILLDEYEYSYSVWESTKPFKKLPMDVLVSKLETLHTLRIFLNTINNEKQFLYELDRLFQNWGPPGENILKPALSNLIERIFHKIKINAEYQALLQQERQQRIIDASKKFVADYTYDEMMRKWPNGLTLNNNNNNNNISINDLDFSSLGFKENQKPKSRGIQKKPSRRKK